MPRVARTPDVRDDLRQIGRYIAEKSGSLEVARRFLRRIDEKCEAYARQPEMGDLRDDLVEGVRLFPVGQYVVVYRTVENGILVLAR